MPKATSKKATCPTSGCTSRIRTPGHDACPRHAPCNQDGWYHPESCKFCRTHLAALAKIPQASQRSSQSWATVDGVIRALRTAISDDPAPGPVLVMDQNLSTWFPDALNGPMGAPVGGPTPSPPPPQAPSPTPAPPSHPAADSERIAALERAVMGLADLPAQFRAFTEAHSRSRARQSRKRDRSSSHRSSSRSDAAASPQPPPSKSRRPSSSSSARSVRTVPRTPSPTPRASDDEVEGDTFSDSGSSDATAPPSASRGWRLCPSYWVCATVDGVVVATDQYAAPDDQPNVKNEITSYGHGVNKQFYYRPRGTIRHLPPTQRDKANRVPQSLASLSPWVRGGQGPCPSVSLAGYGRSTDGCEVSGVSLSPALSLDALPTVWATRVAGDKSAGPDRDETRNDPRPLRQSWPKGSAEERAFTFLQESQSNQVFVPGRLVKPSARTIAKDRQARASAYRALQVSANSDLLSYYLRAAETTDRQWSASDFQSFISAARATSEGISALLAPYTRDLVRAAVSQRIELREEAIPKDMASVRQSLLSLDPLSPFLFGESERVATIINSIPPPATVEIKGLAQLSSLVKSSSQSKGQGQNKGTDNRHSNNKRNGGGGGGKDSHSNENQGRASSSNSNKPFRNSGGHNHKQDDKKPSSSSSDHQNKSSQKKN